MTWTYDVTKLKDEPLHQIRFIIGDVDADVPLLQDEEIEFILQQKQNNIDLTVIACFEALAAKFAKEVDYKVGPEAVSASQKSAKYAALAAKYKKDHTLLSAPIYTKPHGAIFDIDMMNYGKMCHYPEEE